LPITIVPQLDLVTGKLISGTVSNPEWTSEFVADKAAYSVTSWPTNYRGRYTMIVPSTGNPGEPGADGYVTVLVQDDGYIKAKGLFGDGHKRRCSRHRVGEWKLANYRRSMFIQDDGIPPPV
jgi:hypothetical protein